MSEETNGHDNDDEESFQISEGQTQAASLRQLIEINARVGALLMVQCAILAHLTGDDAGDLTKAYAEVVDSLIASTLDKLRKRAIDLQSSSYYDGLD